MYKIIVQEGTFFGFEKGEKDEPERKQLGFYSFLLLCLDHSREQKMMGLKETFQRGKLMTQIAEAKRDEVKEIVVNDEDKDLLIRIVKDEMFKPVTKMVNGKPTTISLWEWISFPIKDESGIGMRFVEAVIDAEKVKEVS